MKSRRMLFLVLAAAIVLSGCSASDSPKAFAVVDGVLDLTEWEFDALKAVELDGQWEFYWNRLLSHIDLQRETPDLLVKVPAAWNQYSIAGERLSGQGHATYRLRVKTGVPAGTTLGLRVHALSSAYKLYVNEQLVATNGQVATNAQDERGEYRPQAVFFSAPAPDFEIILQVSNYHHARGGLWYTIYLGSAAGVLSLHDSVMGREVFLLGALSIIMFFFLAVYLLQRDLKYARYFSLFCACLIVALDMVGQFILLQPFPGLSLNAVILIWYSSIIWGVYLLLRFMHELFQSRFSAIIVKSYFYLSLTAQALYLLTSPAFYTRFAHPGNSLSAVAVLFTILIVVVGIRRGYRDGWLNILSISIVLIAYLHDVLYWTNTTAGNGRETVSGGLFLVLFLQMIIQAGRIKLFQERQTAAELAALQAQIKPHFLYNTLNSFISISRYDMDKARNLIHDFSNYLRRSFDFRSLSQFVPLKHEIELAKAYLEIEKARFDQRIEVAFEVAVDLDLRVPILMLQPLIENAVMHGILPRPEGGRIAVEIVKQDKLIFFSVSDNGVGMKPDKLKAVLEDVGKPGVGLANINRRLRKMFGQGLRIESEFGSGTSVVWSIPVDGGRWKEGEGA